MTPSCLSWADLALKRLGQRVIFLCKIVHARVAVGKKAVHLDLRRAFICRDIKTVPRLGMWLVSDGCQVVPNGCQMVCMGWPSPWVVVGVRWVSGGARWVSDGVHGLALDLGWVRVAFGVGVRLSIIPSSDHIIPIYGHMIMHYTHIWSYDPLPCHAMPCHEGHSARPPFKTVSGRNPVGTKRNHVVTVPETLTGTETLTRILTAKLNRPCHGPVLMHYTRIWSYDHALYPYMVICHT